MTSANSLPSTQRFPLSLAHLGLACAGLMWVFPFLDYYHAFPLTTFYQEWSAAALGLAAAAFVLLSGGYWRQAEVPRIVALPIGLLFLVVVQFVLGDVPYLGQMLLFALYLTWAALLAMVGQRLRDELGLPLLATVLAVCLLVGAELNAACGVLQQYGWHTWLDRVVTIKTSPAVYGNIAQANHFADYVGLGLASLGLLYARGAVRAWQAALLAAPLLFVLTLSGSRSAWLYLLAMTLLAYAWLRRDRALRPLFAYGVAVLAGFGLMHWVVQLPWFAGSASSVTTIQRAFGDVHSGGIRLYLWHESWLMLLQHPLLGAGLGQFAWQHFLLAPTLHNPGIAGLYNNAHNLVMQLAAETGLAGLLILFGTLLPWLWGARQAERSVYHWWGYALLATLGLHSLLEYPMWYAYFIGIAALTLGMLDTRRYRLELHHAGRACVLLALLLGALSLQQLLAGYRTLEALLAPRAPAQQDAAYFDDLRTGLSDLRQESLLQPYAELYLAYMFRLNFERLDATIDYNRRVLRFTPVGATAFRQATLLAQAGELDAARALEERAIWGYPADFPRANADLAELARKDPARYAALLEFSLQKYKEYQGAVRTR